MKTASNVIVLIALIASEGALGARMTADDTRAQRRGLEVSDAIEAARFMETPSGNAEVSMSPDGLRYVVRLVRGDLAHNRNSMELISGRLDSLSAAARHRTIARLFTSGFSVGGSGIRGSDHTTRELNPIRWLDNERIAFFWADQSDILQVIVANVETGETRYATDHPTHVYSFDIGADGTVLYGARSMAASAESKQMEHDRSVRAGFVIPPGTSFTALLDQNRAGAGHYLDVWDTEWFITTPSHPQPRKLRVDGQDLNLDFRPHLWIAPSSREALVDTQPTQIPQDWTRYESLRDPAQRAFDQPRARRTEWFQRMRLKQLFLIDLTTNVSRPLWSAPVHLGTGVAWRPDSRSLLLANTYTPADGADEYGLKGTAVVEIDAATGEFWSFPIKEPVGIGAGIRWLDLDEVEITTYKAELLHFRKREGRWVRQHAPSSTARDQHSPAARVEVSQDINSAPVLYAIADSASRQPILRPNSQALNVWNLGHVERIEWVVSGRTWKGVLYHPVRHAGAARVPLVIQLLAGAPVSTFNVYGGGAGLGPATTMVYAAQMLANRGIAVLTLDTTRDASDAGGTHSESEWRQRASEAVIDQLVASHLVDREKIGLIGFSRTGWHVENIVSRSKYRFAAALAADNIQASYVTAALNDWDAARSLIGAPPFGAGLQDWLAEAPAFNVERIDTPLRKQINTGDLSTIASHWELFSRLSYLRKPVELYVIPHSDRGGHNTQNPAQIYGGQQGAVDWMAYWLKDYEDPDPAKAAQYRRWHVLRRQSDDQRKESGL